MDWHIIWTIADFAFFPVMLIVFFVGLFILFSGLKQVYQGVEREQHVSWRNHPRVFSGMMIISLALFLGLFIASMNISNVAIRVIVAIVALVCGSLPVFYRMSISRRVSLL